QLVQTYKISSNQTMIKVSRVTPYIPINILQIKFIELTVYILPLLYLFSFFTLNCRPAQIAYARFEEEIRKETQKISTVFLFVDFFSFFFTRKAEKTGGNFNSFGFEQLFGCFLPDILPSWFFCAVEVSQGISVAKALVIMFYSVFVEDGYPYKSRCTHTFQSI
ncbi:hypothetical protein ALC60_13495, partial [Trachymyrmex zeteki]